MESLVSEYLSCLSGLGSLSLNSISSLLVSLLLELLESGSLGLGVWVQSVHEGFVGQWVLSGLVVDSNGVSDISKFSLNLVRIDDSGKISTGHLSSWESVSSLSDGFLIVGSENGIELFECILGVDDESTKMTTWGKLEDVKSVNVTDINSWNISSCSLDILGSLRVHNKWSLSHDVSGMSIFTLS